VIDLSGTFTAFFRLRQFIVTHTAQDLTWESSDTFMWVVIETGVYLIAACIPSLRFSIKPVLKGLSIRSLRSRLMGSNPTDAEGSIGLQDKSTSLSSSTTRSGPKAGFERLEEGLYSPLPKGSVKPLAECYFEEGHDERRFGERNRNGGIRVERTLTSESLHTSPNRH
jgi:hypothetical protein